MHRPPSFARCARAAVVALVLIAPGCDRGGRGSLDALSELERLAFVPTGECPVTPTLVCANDVPLLVDRFEVTRASWKSWVAGEADVPPAALAVYDGWPDEEGELPAAYLDHDEARRYAASRGMRLLTAAEWIRVASGTRRQLWPWGYPADSVANTLELGLQRPAAVGTFEQGRTSALDTYDMLGNVWEWVDGRLGDLPEPDDGRGWVMGGSYLTLQRSLLEPYAAVDDVPVYHAELDRRHRAVDVGLRCAADARAYLAAQAPEWGRGAEARERLLAIGAGWGAAAVPLLEELAAEDGAPQGFGWLAEGARR